MYDLSGNVAGPKRRAVARTLFVIPLIVLGLASTDAKANGITFSAPTSFNVFWNFVTPTSSDPLTANATFNVTSFTSSQVDMTLTVRNTTPNYVVSSMGFNTNPAVTASLTSAGSVFTGVANDTNFPGFQTIEVCAFTSSNCSSSANPLALQANSQDTFGLSLTGTFSNSLTLSTFAMKFAGGPDGSFEVGGKVPLPATLLLFAGGFAAFIAWNQYNRRSTSIGLS